AGTGGKGSGSAASGSGLRCPGGRNLLRPGTAFSEPPQIQGSHLVVSAGSFLKKKGRFWGFIREDCYGYLPAVSLCVCYDRIGDLKTAERYNELAGTYKPEDP